LVREFEEKGFLIFFAYRADSFTTDAIATVVVHCETVWGSSSGKKDKDSVFWGMRQSVRGAVEDARPFHVFNMKRLHATARRNLNWVFECFCIYIVIYSRFG
jgi:hypothetical protein